MQREIRLHLLKLDLIPLGIDDLAAVFLLTFEVFGG
jgi:hypothetical protein